MMAVCWRVQKKKEKKKRFFSLNSLNAVSFTQLVLWRKETSWHPWNLLSVGLAAPQVNQVGMNLGPGYDRDVW